jgi:hypothetical protein
MPIYKHFQKRGRPRLVYDVSITRNSKGDAVMYVSPSAFLRHFPFCAAWVALGYDRANNRISVVPSSQHLTGAAKITFPTRGYSVRVGGFIRVLGLKLPIRSNLTQDNDGLWLSVSASKAGRSLAVPPPCPAEGAHKKEAKKCSQ